MSIETFVQRSWEDGSGAGVPLAVAATRFLTTPLSWIWRGVTALRNRRYDVRTPASIPGLAVISVGNLAVGGTGKTPLTRWVVERLRVERTRVAVVSSGYGEDEVLLHRRWYPEVPVLAGRDRAGLLREARGRGIAVAVLDDGFQHRRAPRDLDIVLLAAEHRFPGRVMPRGRYREPWPSLSRADLVVVTRRVASEEESAALAGELTRRLPGVPVARAAFVPAEWMDVHGADASPPEGPVLAVASVAGPEAFLTAVREALPGTHVELRGFPDHHAYTDDEIQALAAAAGPRTIVCTEKDAVKLEALEATPAHVRVLASRLAWDAGEALVEEALTQVLKRGPERERFGKGGAP